MNKLPLAISKKLLLFIEIAQQNESALKSTIVTELINDGALQKVVKGKRNGIIQCNDFSKVQNYLANFYGITHLHEYITALENESNKAELVAVASNSKVKATRSIEGFLVNSIEPLEICIKNIKTILQPIKGVATFISDIKNLQIADDIIIVCIENPYSFINISKQKKYFNGKKYLFVSRYPQSNDIIKWLKNIPNEYLHFGDFDFAGINIYYNEFKKPLGDRANFFVPEHIESLILKHGNRNLFINQKLHCNTSEIDESKVIELITLIHKYGKGLEQEVLIS
jgi:hypothetical protein